MVTRLIDIARGASDTLVQAYAKTFAETTPMLGAIPVESRPSGVYEVVREASLGSSAFRLLGEGYTASEGSEEAQRYYAKPAGGDADVDRAQVRRNPLAKPIVEAMKIKSLAHLIDYTIINGDSASNVREFDGIKTMVTGTPQVLANSGTAAALSLAKLDEAIEMCEGATHIYMQRALKLKLSASTRATGVSGYITHSMDDFGRQVMRYNDLPILISDPLGHSLPPLTGEAEANTSTSIYVLNLSGDDASVCLFEVAPMEIVDFGHTQSAPVERTRVEWDIGLAAKSPRGIVRVTGIDADAAVVV